MAEKATVKVCQDCGNEFTLEQDEINWYVEQGFELPKRCKECRIKRKNARRSKKSNNVQK